MSRFFNDYNPFGYTIWNSDATADDPYKLPIVIVAPEALSDSECTQLIGLSNTHLVLALDHEAIPKIIDKERIFCAPGIKCRGAILIHQLTHTNERLIKILHHAIDPTEDPTLMSLLAEYEDSHSAWYSQLIEHITWLERAFKKILRPDDISVAQACNLERVRSGTHKSVVALYAKFMQEPMVQIPLQKKHLIAVRHIIRFWGLFFGALLGDLKPLHQSLDDHFENSFESITFDAESASSKPESRVKMLERQITSALNTFEAPDIKAELEAFYRESSNCARYINCLVDYLASLAHKVKK